MSNFILNSLFTQNTSITEPLIGLIADLTADPDDHWYPTQGGYRTHCCVLLFLLVLIWLYLCASTIISFYYYIKSENKRDWIILCILQQLIKQVFQVWAARMSVWLQKTQNLTVIFTFDNYELAVTERNGCYSSYKPKLKEEIICCWV